MKKVRRARPGFTLLEGLYSLALLSILSGAVFTLFYANSFAEILSGDQCVAMTDTQEVLREITADLLSANGFVTPANTGGLRVTRSNGSSTVEYVEYYLSGTEIKRLEIAGGTTTTVATGVVSGTGLSLAYYDSSMAPITGSMDSTKYGQAVAVNVTVTTLLEHSSFGQVSRTTRVMLRNKAS